MRLSKIKLAGFKSFVDPTTVYLVSNLVGIVGPNGSGKSNIIDAVRWVMGESSAKHLRGGSMSDVIFSGSSARKPVGQASIELFFDNTVGKKLGGEYAKYDEIAVKRLVTRDGQSVYFLNGAKCRRRDITDIFLGTGLGPRSYAIIEQGMIGRLIEAKPEELRVTLEEAAGISKYKERRRETETRMRHTNENLLRINDLREEMDKQIEKLQRQAKTAEKYTNYKQEERKLKGELLALQWKNIDLEAREKDLAVSQQETKLEAEIASQRSSEAGIEKHREDHIEKTEVFNEVQAKFYQIGADIASKEQNIQHVKSRRSQLDQDLAQVEKDIQEANVHQSADQSRLAQLRERLEELAPKLEEAEERAEISGENLEESEVILNEWQGEWDNFTQSAGEPAKTAEVERTKITHLEEQSRQFENRHTRMQEELVTLDVTELNEEIEQLDERLQQMQAVVDDIHENRQLCQNNIAEIRQQNHEIAEQIAVKRNEMQKMTGRISSLEALQEAALGKNDSQISKWLTERRLSDAPRLAQGIQVEDGWEKAIETVLGFHLEAICVENFTEITQHLSELSDENLAFLNTSVSSITANTSSELQSLSGKVSAEWSIESLLAGVYCAENEQQALSSCSLLKANESIITKTGLWFGPNWLKVNNAKDDRAGVLQREKDLKVLCESLEIINQQIEELLETQELSKQQMQELEAQSEEFQQQLRNEERQLSEIKAQHRAKQARADHNNKRRENIQAEFEELKNQIEKNQENIQQARGRLEIALDEMAINEETRESLLSRRDEVRNAVNEARFTANEDAKQKQTLQLELQSAQSSLSATEQNLGRVDQQIKTLLDRREQLNNILNENEDPLSGLEEELETLLGQRIEIENQLSDARRVMEAIDAEMRELSGRRMQTEQAVEKARETLEQSRMAGQTLKVRRQTIQEQLVEAGYELKLIFETLPDECRIEEWEKNLVDLAQKIQRLGAINLAAIEEYQEQSERKTHLDSQYDDLIEALETLESAIRKIDKETRIRFKETFDKVNEGLKQKFPKLFGGGQAYLEMTGEDLLDTGVAILARPPGKRVTNIHLLSGGEKALTAVALVFSIFELNPAPFCMLDEVDAPLDEANVGRFSNLVKEMSEQVQFIFISHNKATMEIATNLNGVTMHEPGVSRIVSVDVQEAAELAAI